MNSETLTEEGDENLLSTVYFSGSDRMNNDLGVPTRLVVGHLISVCPLGSPLIDLVDRNGSGLLTENLCPWLYVSKIR